MLRDDFARRLRLAAAEAYALATRYIEEPLPAPLVFRPRFDASHDDDQALYADEVVVSDDRAPVDCSETEALALLWRDGRVPAWIRAAVIGETGTATRIELACCRRFTASEDLLHHMHSELGPFEAIGPARPADHGDTFSLYREVECAAPDIAHLRHHAAKVHTLVLDGDVADVPPLPNLEVLHGHASSWNFARFPQLRELVLDITSAIHIPPEAMPALERVELYNLRGPFGLQALLDAAPELGWLTLHSEAPLVLDARGALQVLELRAPRLAGTLALTAPLDSLRLDVAQLDDAVLAWLATATRNLYITASAAVIAQLRAASPAMRVYNRT